MTTRHTFPKTVIAVAAAVLLVIFIYALSGFFVKAEIKQHDNAEDSTFLEDLWMVSQTRHSSVECAYTDGPDLDEDGVLDLCDNCIEYFNPEQEDNDNDGVGNACDFSNNRNNDENNGGGEDNETEIECSRDSDCGDDRFVGEPSCVGLNVTQDYKRWSCENAGTNESRCTSDTTERIVEMCTDICVLDHCVVRNITCSSNSDCGIDGYLGNNFCSGLNVVRTFRSFVCEHAATPESFCAPPVLQNRTVNACEDACVNGACRDVRCSNDAECGSDGYNGASFCLNNAIYRNFEDFFCLYPTTINSLCDSNVTTRTLQNCQYACTNDACIRCDENSDCNDLNASTQDICRSAGTPFSSCSNDPIVTCQNACTDGARRCSNNGYQICHDYNGDSCTEWSQATQCSSGQTCSSGNCVNNPPTCSNQCTAGQRQCSGNGVQTCNDFNGDGCAEWGSASPCNSGQTCVSGSCTTQPPTCTNQCTSGQRQCSGNGYQMCGDFNGDGCSEWSQATQCNSGQTCQSGTCVTPQPTCTNQCVAGSHQCSGNGVQSCQDYNGDGCTEWSQVSSCSSGQTCIAGNCVTPTPTCSNQCTDGARRCSNNGYQICHDYNGDSCTEWSQATMCSFGQVCILGACQ